MTKRNPNTFIVGAGPCATALAGALRLGGIPVLGLWARRPQAARTAGSIAGVASYSAAPPDLMLEAEVVILAVRDDAIAEVAAMLVQTGMITTRHVMLHCSGAMSAAEAFAGVRERLGGVGTLHPLRAVADGRKGMQAMRGTVFGIEGDERGAAEATLLCRAMGGVPLALSGAQMAAYHAAAAMASNLVVALVDAAAELLGQAGVAEPEALGALVPLALGSLGNVAELGAASGLTGPVRRGDVATVERHLRALGGAPELLAIYRTLGRRAVDIARRAGQAPARDLDAISALLGSQATPRVDASPATHDSGVEPRAHRA